MQLVGSLHPAWSRLLSQLAELGILRGVAERQASSILGAAGDQAPNPLALADLLARWYMADGDWVEALWRRQSDRVVHLPSDQIQPVDVAAQITHALPDLDPLHVTSTPEAVLLASHEDQVALSRLVRHARIPTRSRRVPLGSPRALVRGANALLARRDHPLRFVPLYMPQPLGCFVAVNERGARTLARLAVTEVNGTALQTFTAFEPTLARAAG
jgi:hypothetical protein